MKEWYMTGIVYILLPHLLKNFLVSSILKNEKRGNGEFSKNNSPENDG